MPLIQLIKICQEISRKIRLKTKEEEEQLIPINRVATYMEFKYLM